MALIGEEDRQYLEQRFAQDLQSQVTIEFYSRGSYNLSVNETEEEEEITEQTATAHANRISFRLYREVTELTPRLNFSWQDLDTPAGQHSAAEAGIAPEMLPAARFRSENMAGQTRFFGIPSGYEFGALVENLIDLSAARQHLTQSTLNALKELDKPAHIKVFVTPT